MHPRACSPAFPVGNGRRHKPLGPLFAKGICGLLILGRITHTRVDDVPAELADGASEKELGGNGHYLLPAEPLAARPGHSLISARSVFSQALDESLHFRGSSCGSPVTERLPWGRSSDPVSNNVLQHNRRPLSGGRTSTRSLRHDRLGDGWVPETGSMPLSRAYRPRRTRPSRPPSAIAARTGALYSVLTKIAYLLIRLGFPDQTWSEFSGVSGPVDSGKSTS